MDWTTYAIIVGLVVVFAIVVWIWWGSSPPTSLMKWVPLTEAVAGVHEQWDLTGFELQRPWTGRDSGIAEYYGIIEAKLGQQLDIEISPLYNYWEFNIYSYPSWKHCRTVPMQQKVTIPIVQPNQSGPNQLPPGHYCVILRTVHPPIRHDGNMISLSPGASTNEGVRVSTKTAKASQMTLDSPLPVLNDEAEYDNVAATHAHVIEELTRQGYTQLDTRRSHEVRVLPESPYIRHEQVDFITGGPCLVLVIQSQRKVDKVSIQTDQMYHDNIWRLSGGDAGDLTISTAEQIGYGNTSYQLRVIEESGRRVMIDEYVCGVDPSSQLLPFYVYIFTRN